MAPDQATPLRSSPLKAIASPGGHQKSEIQMIFEQFEEDIAGDKLIHHIFNEFEIRIQGDQQAILDKLQNSLKLTEHLPKDTRLPKTRGNF